MRHIHQAAFTLVELMVVITIIGVLAAMLVPSMEQAVEQARIARCASQMRQIATGWFAYIQDHQGKLPGVQYIGQGSGRVKNFADPAVYTVVPNPLGSLVPYFGGGRAAFRCPTPPPIAQDEWRPNELSDSNYLPNGVVFLLKMPQVVRAADTVFMQEAIFRANSIWYRPGDRNPDNADERYEWWHFTRDGAGQEFSFLHNQGGNLVFGDAHVEYRKGAELRARDFGLTGGPGVTGNADDTQKTPDNWTYRPAD